MKPRLTIFLQIVVVVAGLATLALMIRFPQHEGRAQQADLVTIYTDPLILYVYAASIAFFAALYKVFRLLGYIRQNLVFSAKAVKAVSSIKRYAVLLALLIIGAGIIIRIFHAPEDDPAGFIALCIIATVATAAVAAAAAVVETILQKGMDVKAENERLSGQSR